MVRDEEKGVQLSEKRFNMYAEFKSVKDEDDHIFVEGYASTFAEDMDGEIIDPGAFDGALDIYKLNPVILTDHTNTVQHVVGKVLDAKVDSTGLWIRAQLSNSNDPYTSMVRQKVKEGILRAFSIGGLFSYEYPIIKKIKLLEISIVPIPANSYSLFSMSKAWKALDIGERQAKNDLGPDGSKEAAAQTETVAASPGVLDKEKMFNDLVDLLTKKERMKPYVKPKQQ